MMTMILKSELKYQNFVIKDKFENFLQYILYISEMRANSW